MHESRAAHPLVDESWDAVVVGAGPAGAVSAYLLARQGRRTLLVDAKPFPREKVCGGCLNPRAIASLQAMGLEQSLDDCGAAAIDRLSLRHQQRRVEIALPQGLSVTRRTLDARFVEAACRAGVTFRPETRARVEPADGSTVRTLRLSSASGLAQRVAAKVVLACDGLGHPSVRELPESQSRVGRMSRIGIGVVLEHADGRDIVPRGSIVMAVAREGYVGLAQAEGGRVSVAAAIDPHALGGSKSPAEVVGGILRQAGVPTDVLPPDVTLRGTPPITQRALRVAGERLFLLGDAAGYVEPFTGEGMAMALAGAEAVAPLAMRAIDAWQPQLANQWQRTYARRFRSRQFACRGIAWVMRHPQVLRWSLAGIERRPQLGAAIGQWIGRENTKQGYATP